MLDILLVLPLNAPNLLESVIMEHQAYTNKLFETENILTNHAEFDPADPLESINNNREA